MMRPFSYLSTCWLPRLPSGLPPAYDTEAAKVRGR